MMQDTASQTSISYANEFFDGAVAKIDGAFGPGFAKDNPELVGAYLNACSSNLSVMIQASLAATELEGLLEEIDLDFAEPPPPQPKRRGRR